MTGAPFRGHSLFVTNLSSVSEVSHAGPGPEIASGALEASRTSRPSLQPLELASPATQAERAAARALTFRALYDAHLDFVWRNLRRLGVSEADAEDRTQEVFVVAHRRFVEFEDRGHGPRAWLFQIVLRVASDARRHKRRHPEDPDGGLAMGRASVDAPQQEAVLRREQLSRLDAALDTIDVGRRAVLVLHEIEEMTAPEIAQVLGIPLNTVYSRLRVARAELEEALRRQEDPR
jgi:RNA polymerase sigma-70 factor (ECF subfamily)